MHTDKFLIVIGGPTAAGKTDIAIRLASRMGCEILSADSRQFYREMTIGTAKPTREQLSALPHHFIDCESVRTPYDIHRFEKEALTFLDDYFQSRQTAVLTGGSGLYIDALTNGIDDLPGRDATYRRELEGLLSEKGISPLQNLLWEIDPETAGAIDLKNHVRLIRALEICKVAGMPVSALRNRSAHRRNFKTIRIAVSPDRETLYERINLRVDQMMHSGLAEEVKGLSDLRNHAALRTVGYTELFDHLDGKTDLTEAVELIKQHTRNYAKRQLTWFRNKGDYRWFAPDQVEEMFSYIREEMN